MQRKAGFHPIWPCHIPAPRLPPEPVAETALNSALLKINVWFIFDGSGVKLPGAHKPNRESDMQLALRMQQFSPLTRRGKNRKSVQMLGHITTSM